MRRLLLYLMALLYILAGINHFLNTETYMAIMPPWLPAHRWLVFVSGIAEIMLGTLLLPRKSRRLAAWGIIALLITVFPANLQMALDWHRQGHAHEWMAWLRLPLQIVLVWWAWRYTRRQGNE